MASLKESKIMQETGQPEDATADTEGESIEDEIVKEFYKEIVNRDEKSTSFEEIASNAKRYSLINSVSEHYIEDGTSATALSYAIHHESYSIVQQILDDLKIQPRDIQMAPIVETDDDGNNALQKLIKTIEYRVVPLPTENVAPKVKTILSTFLKFDLSLLKHENNTGETALTQALMCTKYTARGDTLFIHMMDDIPDNKGRIEAIREKQTKCSSDDCKSSDKLHIAECTAGYNLLMLALTSDNRKNHKYLVDIVDQADVDVKLELVIGDRGGKLNTNWPNSIRVAANNEQWDALEDLLKCVASVDRINLANMLIDEDERLDSAMKRIVQSEGTAVKALLKLSNSKLRKELDAAFQSNIDRIKFLKQQMSVDSIIEFHDANLFVDSFLLPKPSRDERLSRPHAMICYNTFANGTAPELKGAKRGAEAIQTALVSLGWDIKTEDCISGWSFSHLKEMIEDQLGMCKNRASILLLCITTHGQDNHLVGEINPKENFGSINEILRIVKNNAERSIPKVVIIDTCREEATEPKDEHVVIRESNMLLLLGTSYGQKAGAGRYLRELAKQIEKADGATTLEEMHYEATKVVKERNHRSHIIQDPQKLSAGKRIKLRNWKKEPNKCTRHLRGDPLQCRRCDENVCPGCIEIMKTNRVLQHPNVRLFCTACCKRVDRG